MFDISNIYEPKTMEEALDILDNKENIKIIAGGTDVLIKLHHGDMLGIELLSIRNIDELKAIQLNDNEDIEIGAMSSFTDIFRNEIINENIYVLSEAAVSMGGPQVRNMATIGGNVCNGAVSADSATTLFALNAQLLLRRKNEERIVPIREFYLGPGKVSILPDEILVKIIIRKEDYKGYKGNYIKFSNRKAMDIAMLGVSVVGAIENNKFNDLRISLGVAAPTPVRCLKAEDFARGIEINMKNIIEISEKALLDAKPRNSWRGSKDFREHLIKELTKRGILEVIKRAGGVVNE
ncbi:MAG: xanthine dehydrogenase FAD-binding subunit XdhB [Clostridium sp.]|uniref:xanthine dehydrogenase FAD-binding subunit XdhB n=1 Tax=Clostridium sp. TaxID=1506 RepID=UPI001EB9F385|nr:xanthine dehydrogenase FAD-binding subunit XdhB [Clostridium sp.]MBS5883501.1 xanthine dehydrogenase FAD-binding subunit XdhB [Clostridium sp.]MDU7147125.1 xanthine dehydrogenase FAD-binding subunit XdhB [Clostridium sp.]MDU7240221.1 xanthine dehydrogenase FAD-binding subunit XdhB [Clostridium sp.]